MTKRTIEVDTSAPQRPETVRDLISLLAMYPMDHQVSFAPFNLYRTHDAGDCVHFEMQETEGTHYKMIENLDG